MQILENLSNNKNTRKIIILLAWPVILTNLLHTFTVTIDLIMVGRLGSTAIASVGLGSQIIFISFSVMIAVSVGTLSLVARSIGAKENDMANLVLKQSLVIGFLISIPIMLFGIFLGEHLLVLLGAERDVVIEGTKYIQIIFSFSLFSFINFLSAAAFRGAGDTKTPLFVGFIVTFSNIILNYLLIFGKFGFPEMKVTGAAIGTACSFIIGSCVYLILLLKRKRILTLHIKGKRIDLETLKRILNVGIPAGIEQMTIQLGFMIYVILIIKFGTDALAAHHIGMRIQSLSFMPGLGFSMAAATLVGQNLGAKNPEQAEKSGWESLKLCLITMIVISSVIFIIAGKVANIFVEEKETLDLAVEWIRILAIGIPAIGIYFTIAGGLRGGGDTKWPLYVSIIGIYGTRLPIAIFLGFYTKLGIHGVWISLPIEYYIRALVISLRFKSGKWKAIKI